MLSAYARRPGGRFIRYGSTATGRMRRHSDVDIIADFGDELAGPAASYAEDVCFEKEMLPDVRAVTYASPQLVARALTTNLSRPARNATRHCFAGSKKPRPGPAQPWWRNRN